MNSMNELPEDAGPGATPPARATPASERDALVALADEVARLQRTLSPALAAKPARLLAILASQKPQP